MLCDALGMDNGLRPLVDQPVDGGAEGVGALVIVAADRLLDGVLGGRAVEQIGAGAIGDMQQQPVPKQGEE